MWTKAKHIERENSRKELKAKLVNNLSIIDVRTEKKSVVSVALRKATKKSISYGKTVRYNRINLRV